MTSNLRATMSLVTRRRPAFVMTPPRAGRATAGTRHVPVPLRLLLGGR